jgi:AcrR family transcriptional regulator
MSVRLVRFRAQAECIEMKRETSKARRRRSDPVEIVRVARALFIRYGIRRTSMDDVAKAANAAKGTVYLAFDSKEALFRAVCEDVCDELLTRTREAAQRIDAPTERILARLEAKYAWLHGWVQTSPHADELLSSKDSVAADILKKMDVRFAAELADDVKSLWVGLTTELAFEYARTLMRTARACGLPDEGEPVPTERVVQARIRETVRALLGGLALSASKHDAAAQKASRPA